MSRPALVLIPGMMCDARLFWPQVAHFSGSHAVQVANITRQTTVAALARDVLASAPARFALAGLSMGGIVAMEVIRQAPGRILGIALLDTNPLAEADQIQEVRQPQIAAAQAGRVMDVMERDMFPRYTADTPRRADILETCRIMARTLGPEVFVRQSLALRDRPDQSHTLNQSQLPTLILCGAEDQMCPPGRHELMHSLMPHADLKVLKRTGHLSTLERPDETIAALSAWLEIL